jgi:hypothetical protein
LINLDLSDSTKFAGISSFNKTSAFPAREDEDSSLVEQFEMVKKLWKILDEGKLDYEIPLKTVEKFLVSRNIASDLSVANKIIRQSQINKTSNVVNYDEFKRIF